MKKIIVTGFEPFGNYKFNPVQDMARDFDKRIIDNIQVEGIVLPCTYRGAFEKLKGIIDKENPIAIVSLGFSSSIKRIMVETKAYNSMASQYSDANGESPQGDSIIEDAELTLSLNSNAQKIASILDENNISNGISSNGGYFICNSLMYLTTYYILTNNLGIKNVFLHTPWTDKFIEKIGKLEDDKIYISNSDLYLAVNAIIRNIKEI